MDNLTNESSTTTGQVIKVSKSSIAGLMTSIFEDCLYNLIHDLVLSIHQNEKLLHMSSVAVQAFNAANSAVSGNGEASAGFPLKNNHVTGQSPQIRVVVPGAVYENGRITLVGNSLQTTQEIYCVQCKLPRLLYPLQGVGARIPDFKKSSQWCSRHPFIKMSGHDIYGNPFPTDPAKTKKEREQLKQQQQLQQQQAITEKDSTPASFTGDDANSPDDADCQTTGQATGQTSATAAAMAKLSAGSGKPAHYIPWHTCPNCKRSLLVTRFAQHLEKCLGIAGRASSRNAMARMTGNSSTRQATPLSSRESSRVVSPALKRSREESIGRDKSNMVMMMEDNDGDNNEDETKSIRKKKSLKREPSERDSIKIRIRGSSSSSSLAATTSNGNVPKVSDLTQQSSNLAHIC